MDTTIVLYVCQMDIALPLHKINYTFILFEVNNNRNKYIWSTTVRSYESNQNKT